MFSRLTILARESAGHSRGAATIMPVGVALGEGPASRMRVIVPLLLSLAMWGFIILGLIGLWLKIFG